MSELVKILQPIAEQKKLVPAEGPICELLLDFEQKIAEISDDSDLTSILSLLMKILHINDGKLSMYCSIRIAECIKAVYEAKKSKDYSEIITAATKNPIQSIIYVIAHLLKTADKSIKDKIPSFTNVLLKLGEELYHGMMFALRRCYKCNSQDLAQYNDKVLVKIVFCLSDGDEAAQLMALKLCRKLVRCDCIDVPKLYGILLNFLKMKDHLQNFVIDDACYLVAVCASLPLIRQTPTQELYEEAAKVFMLFKEHLTACLRHFLDIVPPKFIAEHFLSLFNSLKVMSLSDVSQLLPYISSETRTKLFNKISTEGVSFNTLMCLRMLANSLSLAQETASIALQMAQNINDDVRSGLQSFFAYLAQLYPDLANQYLESSLLYLANPPDVTETPNTVEGMVFVAASIIGGSEDPEKTLSPYISYIQKFLDDTFTHFKLYSHKTNAAFRLLCITPKEIVPLEHVNRAINSLTKDIMESKCDITSHSVKEIVRSVNCALYSHPYLAAANKYLEAAARLTLINSSTSNMAMFLDLPLVKPDCQVDVAISLVRKITSLKPPMHSILMMLKNPMQLQDELLFHAVIITFTKGPLYSNVNSATFAMRVITTIGQFVKAMKPGAAIRFVNDVMGAHGELLMIHSCILTLVREDLIRFMPANTIEYLLETLDKRNTDYDRMRVSAESLATYVSKTDKLSFVLDQIKDWHCVGKCLVIANLIQFCHFTDDQVFKCMLDLNELAKTHPTAPYALFALSVIYDVYAGILIGNPLLSGQLQAMIRCLNSYSGLNSFTFYYLTQAFGKILPIAAVDYENNSKEILILVNLLSQTNIPYSRQISYQIWRFVSTYLPQLKSAITVKYPTQTNITMSQEIALTSALAEYITLVDPKIDIFASAPRILYLVQKKEDPRPVELFMAMIDSQCDHSEDMYTLARDVIKDSKFPGLNPNDIEPLTHTIACCVQIITKLLPKIGKMHTEEIIAMSIKVITKELPKTAATAYKLLAEMLRLEIITIKDFVDDLSVAIKKSPIQDLSGCMEFIQEVIKSMKDNKEGEHINTLCNAFISLFDRADVNVKSVALAISLLSMSTAVNNENLKKEILEKFKLKAKEMIHEIKEKFTANDWSYIGESKKLFPHGLGDLYVCSKIDELELDQKSILEFAEEESKARDEWRSGPAKLFVSHQ